MRNVAIIVTHGAESERPAMDQNCTYQVKIDVYNDTYQCMNQEQYTAYQQQKAVENAQSEHQSAVFFGWSGAFIAVGVIAGLLFALFKKLRSRRNG